MATVKCTDRYDKEIDCAEAENGNYLQIKCKPYYEIEWPYDSARCENYKWTLRKMSVCKPGKFLTVICSPVHQLVDGTTRFI